MLDLSALDECIATYKQLTELEGLTPQTRGQRLNALIAKVLEAHHIPARSSQISKGEIDVAFRVNGKRFLLEAKWERSPIGVNAIAKLKLRIDQRMSSDSAILLSMSGFTREAIKQMDQAGRPEIILVNPDIFEALLYGAFDAPVLFDACVDVAAFEGKYCLELANIIPYLQGKTDKSVDPVSADAPVPNEVHRRLCPTGNFAEARVVKANLPFGQLGVSASGGSLYVTLNDGLYRLHRQKFIKMHSFKDPQNRCIHDPNTEKSYFVHNGAVLAFEKSGKVLVVSKKRPGHVRLFKDHAINIISNGCEFGDSRRPVTLVRDLLGENLEIPTNYPAGCAVDACFIDQRRYAIIGSAGLEVFDEGKSAWSVDVINGASISFHGERIFFLENGIHLKSVDIDGKNNTSLIRFNLGGSVGDFAVLNESELYFHLYYQDDRHRSKGALVYVRL